MRARARARRADALPEAARRNRVPPPAPARRWRRIAAHSKAHARAVRRACGPFGAAAEIKDEKAGRRPPRLDLRRRARRSTASRCRRAASSWRPGPQVAGRRPGTRAALPEQAPALRIEFAEGVPASPATIEVEVLRSPDPVPFVALSFGGYSLLALGDLKQSNAFAGVPLHGLERELVQVQSVQKAVLVAGSLRRRPAGPGRRRPAGSAQPGGVDDRAASDRFRASGD